MNPARTVARLRRRGLTGAAIGVGHLDSGVDTSDERLTSGVASFCYFDAFGDPAPGRKPFDATGHGTQTASIVLGATGGSVEGVAPGCRLHSAAVLEGGRVLARVLSGMAWLLDAPIRVLLMPCGVPGATRLFRPIVAAFAARGILVVAPIGNEGAGRWHAPGDDAAVLSVGAVDGEGRIPAFSGSLNVPGKLDCLKPDIVAPGVDVQGMGSGTSMAAAFVAGLAANLFEAVPDASAIDVINALCRSARPLPAPARHRCRAGIVDPVAALRVLQGGAMAPGPSVRRLPARGRLDPRLERQMAWAAPGERVPAIAIMSKAACRHDAVETLVTASNGGASGLRRLRFNRPARAVLLDARASRLRHLLRSPDVEYLAAQDVDLLPVSDGWARDPSLHVESSRDHLYRRSKQL